MEAVHTRADGESRPEAAVGKDPKHPHEYRVFRTGSALRTAGYQPVTGSAVVFGCWADYLHIRGD
jgi:hypothetical protein